MLHGDNTVVIASKNLFNSAKEVTENGYLNVNGTFTNASDWLGLTSFMEILPSTSYIASLKNMGTRFIWCEYDSNKTVIGTRKENTTGAITTSANAKYIRFCTNSNIATDIQLEIGSTATAYEPYISQTQLLSLGSIELAKIGTYTDRIFKSSGKWYVEKNIGERIITGDEDISLYSGNLFLIRSFVRKLANTLPMSNYYVGDSRNAGMTTLPNFYFAMQSLANFLVSSAYIQDNRYSDGTSYANYLKGLYQANAPLKFKFVLETPTTTEITDTTLIGQLENVLKMHTNKNVTNISIVPTGTNAEPTAEVEYRQDLQTVIGNISNAIISLGGNV